MTTDDQFCWKSHNKHVQTEVSRSILVINEAKQVLDHCSPVIPYLNYCAEVWGNIDRGTIHPLLILHKKTNQTKKNNTDHSQGRIWGSHKFVIITVKITKI